MVWMPHWPYVLEKSSIKLGLERINKLLDVLGNPQDKIPPVIHIGGTNGKGSTTAFIKAILEEAGLKVHVYTSPHLKQFNERIQIAGEQISDDYLYSILEECRIIAEKNDITPSFFEGITAAAFVAFSRNPADITIVEVGMGGRLDATNVFKKPLLTILTPISYDHMTSLGNTLTQISSEKVPILKPGCPSVISAQTDEVHRVIENYADKFKVPLFRYEYDYGIEPESDGSFYYLAENDKIHFPEPGLKGLHQYLNASAAIAAVKLLKGIEITNQMISRGLQKAYWPGRLQKIAAGNLYKLLPSNSEVFLDGAHNESGAQVLFTWLSLQPQMKTYMIFGLTHNRKPNDFLKYFKSSKLKIICTNVHSEPCSYRGKDLQSMVAEYGFEDTLSANNVEEALEKIASENSEPVRVIVCGSLFLVADFLISN